MRRKNAFHDMFKLINTVLPALISITILFCLMLGTVMVNLFIRELPPSIKTKQEQELTIIRNQAERDRAQFNRLRKKHGLSATAVVIYEPGKPPFYYGPGKEEIALK